LPDAKIFGDPRHQGDDRTSRPNNEPLAPSPRTERHLGSERYRLDRYREHPVIGRPEAER
jgi:hypothetical protein